MNVRRHDITREWGFGRWWGILTLRSVKLANRLEVEAHDPMTLWIQIDISLNSEICIDWWIPWNLIIQEECVFQGSEVFPNELEVPNMFRHQEPPIVGLQQRLLRSPENIAGGRSSFCQSRFESCILSCGKSMELQSCNRSRSTLTFTCFTLETTFEH